MAAPYKTPGVYVEEISKLPPSVAQVETAIPAFIGYTENDMHNGNTLVAKPTRIKSLTEYVEIFGFPLPAKFITEGSTTVKIKKENGEYKLDASLKDPFDKTMYALYYSLQIYFANGGGPCYIVSAGKYKAAGGVNKDELIAALNAVKKEDEPTMIVFTDSVALNSRDDFHELYQMALAQAAELMDRVVIMDTYILDKAELSVPFDKTPAGETKSVGELLRNGIGNNFMSYGAAYFPWLKTNLNYFLDESKISITQGTGIDDTDFEAATVLKKSPAPPATQLTPAEAAKSLYHKNSVVYALVKKEIEKHKLILPPSPAIAGVYAMVDSTRGVWKAPANVSLNLVKEPMVKIDDEDQREMNVSTTGKSVNAIRQFSGKGVLVWGARTLAGNDNEWRYISVRRFYNMVEESVKKATEPFVFEPNDANTWVKVKGMIEAFLTLQWRAGALMGAKPEEAFFVHVGLGETMTALDIFEGRLIVEIGLAVVRPAEFIILRFSHKMIES
jgi:phage tail sheath protein FI